jgi:hypothetical protein
MSIQFFALNLLVKLFEQFQLGVATTSLCNSYLWTIVFNENKSDLYTVFKARFSYFLEQYRGRLKPINRFNINIDIFDTDTKSQIDLHPWCTLQNILNIK